ncbi:MAG: hypothetical protein ACRD7E_18980, partial [Bryobacteraceae bacterium]
MRRRNFLIGIASSALGGAVLATSHWTLFWRYTERGFAQYLRLRCYSLQLEVSDSEFEKFVRLYKKYYGWRRARWAPGALEPITAVFLLSTDFFVNGADESKPVRFRQFFHPYV